MWVAESMALWQQGRAFRWVMLGEDRRKILGSVEVSVPTLEAPVGRMGYWVRRGASGQGVCSQAAAQALDWVFSSLGLQRVELFIQPAKEASIRVARKLGAEFIDQQHDEVVYQGESRELTLGRAAAGSPPMAADARIRGWHRQQAARLNRVLLRIQKVRKKSLSVVVNPAFKMPILDVRGVSTALGKINSDRGRKPAVMLGRDNWIIRRS